MHHHASQKSSRGRPLVGALVLFAAALVAVGFVLAVTKATNLLDQDASADGNQPKLWRFTVR